jgi:hypothetical protein
MKKVLAILAALSLTAASQADLILNALGTTTYDFNSYAGSAAPTDWTVFGNAAMTWNNLDSGSSTAGGGRSYTNAGPNRALGFLGSGTLTNMTAQLVVDNQTGSTITDITLRFSVLQYRSANGGRPSTLTFSDVTNLGFTEPTYVASTAGATGAIIPPSSLGTYSETISGLNIANGSTFTLEWLYDRAPGSGSSQGIGLDDVVITVVPEPATLSFLALGLLGLAYRRIR